jgi:integration host factor subunit alpha
MNKTMLVTLTAGNTEQTKAQTEATLTIAFDIIRGAVARGETVRLADFGTFESRHISDRDKRNSQAGDPVNDVRVVKFSPAEAFRKEVNHRL